VQRGRPGGWKATKVVKLYVLYLPSALSFSALFSCAEIKILGVGEGAEVVSVSVSAALT